MSYLYNDNEIAYIKGSIKAIDTNKDTKIKVSDKEYCHIYNSITSFQQEYGMKITIRQALILMLIEDAIEYAKSLQREFE